MDAAIEECEGLASLGVVVAASEREAEPEELDDGQLPTDGNFGRRYVGSLSVSLRSCDDAHHEGS